MTIVRLAAGLTIVASLALGQQPSLDATLHARIAGFSGKVTLYAKNLETGATVGIGESEPVRTASTIKLAIMAAVFDAVEHGRAKWNEPLTVTPQEKVSGSGVIGQEFSDGVQLPLRDVMHLMIVLSDNTATNMILERFTAESVNQYLDSIGIKTTRSMRKIMSGEKTAGFSKAGLLPENKKYGLGVSTPRDMVAILEKIERGELVSPAASKEMIAVLKRNQDNSGITRRMMDLPIAHKTGALDALRADVGIVYAKTGRVALAVYVDGMPKPDWSPDNAGSLMIADLAKTIVDQLK